MKIASLENKIEFAADGANVGGPPCAVLWGAIALWTLLA